MKVNRIICSVVVLLVMMSTKVEAQFGIGLTTSYELYNVIHNPDDNIAHNGNGSALTTFGLGPKIWLGFQSFSISAETQANISLFGLALSDYKGLGAVTFPIMAKLNFGGLAATNKDGNFGFSIGGGIQYNKTEIYGLRQEFEDRGVQRNFFRTYNVQLGYGFGMSGFAGYFFARYGFNRDLPGANNFHVGLQADFNILGLKKIKRKESEL